MTFQRPMVWAVFCFIAGILLNRWVSFSEEALAAAVMAGIAGTAALRRRRIFRIVFISILIAVSGIIATQRYLSLPKDHVVYIAKYYKKKSILLQGIVVSESRQRNKPYGPKTSFELDVRGMKTRFGWQKKSGRIIVNVYRKVEVKYGDYLVVEGKMHRPFNFASSSFSYRDYLARKKIHLILSVKKSAILQPLARETGSLWKSRSLKVKDRLREIISRHLSRNEAILMQAIFLGDRTEIPKPVHQWFVHTGTAHILAISGFNVGIIAGLIFLLLKTMPIGRRTQYLTTIFLLVFYSFLTGGQPPVVRATIMAAVFLLSFVLEKETDGFNTLAFSALLILLINPMSLYDAGFQMSFLSVLTIMVFYPQLMAWVNSRWPVLENKPWVWVMQSFAVTVSALIGVSGLVAIYFHIITTPVTLLANLFISPLMVMILALGLGLILSGLILPPLSFFFALCLKLVLNAMVLTAYLFNLIPFAYFYIEKIPIWSIIVYHVLVVLLMLCKRGQRPKGAVPSTRRVIDKAN